MVVFCPPAAVLMPMADHPVYYLYSPVELSLDLEASFLILVLAGASIGVGFVFSSLIIGTSRNSGLKDELFKFPILGFALTEASELYGINHGFMPIVIQSLTPSNTQIRNTSFRPIFAFFLICFFFRLSWSIRR